jgi:hypothetical protein
MNGSTGADDVAALGAIEAQSFLDILLKPHHVTIAKGVFVDVAGAKPNCSQREAVNAFKPFSPDPYNLSAASPDIEANCSLSGGDKVLNSIINSQSFLFFGQNLQFQLVFLQDLICDILAVLCPT